MSKLMDPRNLSTADAKKLIGELTARIEDLEADKKALEETLSETQATNKLLLDGQEHFRTIVDSEPGCVKLLSLEGHVMSMNPAGVAIVEAESEDQVVGKSIYELIDESDREAFKDLNRRVFDGESCGMEYSLTGLGGTVYRLETHAAPLRDARGKVVAHLGITHDITGRMRDQQELIEYRDHLEDLVAHRTEELHRSREAAIRAERLAALGTLAAGVAHELNNPLGTIRLGAELALQSTQDETTRSTLEAIRADVARCGRIMKSVLQFSREESSAKWPISLNTTARLARDRTRRIASENQVTVELELDDDLGWIIGNETELEQVLINLIDNGVRAAPNAGRVVVRTRMDGDRIICDVEDNGCGMSPEHQSQAFDPFFTTRIKGGGTGLGLSVSHGIIRDHGGTIEITSKEGAGAKISVSFDRE